MQQCRMSIRDRPARHGCGDLTMVSSMFVSRSLSHSTEHRRAYSETPSVTVNFMVRHLVRRDMAVIFNNSVLHNLHPARHNTSVLVQQWSGWILSLRLAVACNVMSLLNTIYRSIGVQVQHQRTAAYQYQWVYQSRMVYPCKLTVVTTTARTHHDLKQSRIRNMSLLGGRVEASYVKVE